MEDGTVTDDVPQAARNPLLPFQNKLVFIPTFELVGEFELHRPCGYYTVGGLLVDGVSARFSGIASGIMALTP